MRGGSFHLPRTPQARGDKCTTTREPRPCRAGVLVFPRSRRFYGPPSPRVCTLTIWLKAGMVVADDSGARPLSSPRTDTESRTPRLIFSGGAFCCLGPRRARLVRAPAANELGRRSPASGARPRAVGAKRR